MRGEKRVFRGGTTARATGKDGTALRFLFTEGIHPSSPQPAHLLGEDEMGQNLLPSLLDPADGLTLDVTVP